MLLWWNGYWNRNHGNDGNDWDRNHWNYNHGDDRDDWNWNHWNRHEHWHGNRRRVYTPILPVLTPIYRLLYTNSSGLFAGAGRTLHLFA